MAGNMKSVKLRMKSIQNTMQITRAMELVASSRLRRAKERAEICRPYFQELYETLREIARGNTDFSSLYVKEGKNEKCCYIVIAGDRGLAGGLHANLFKCLEEDSKEKEYVALPIGKKAVEYFRRRGIPCLTEAFVEAARVSVADCFEMADLLCREFSAGSFGHIELCYTGFVSMLSQEPKVISMLPLKDLEEKEKKPVRNLLLYEPDAETVFQAIVPEYLAGLIYGAVCEGEASELAARRTAMEAATNNAQEMLDKLELYYNQARQAGITQEITEIVSGAQEL